MTLGTATSQYEICPCQPECPLCESGAGHISVRRVDQELGLHGQRAKFSQEANFGTHIREALDIVFDWAAESRRGGESACK